MRIHAPFQQGDRARPSQAASLPVPGFRIWYCVWCPGMACDGRSAKVFEWENPRTTWHWIITGEPTRNADIMGILWNMRIYIHILSYIWDMRHVIGIQWDIPSDRNLVDFPASHVSKQGHHSQHACMACWRRVAEPRSELSQRCGSFGWAKILLSRGVQNPSGSYSSLTIKNSDAGFFQGIDVCYVESPSKGLIYRNPDLRKKIA